MTTWKFRDDGTEKRSAIDYIFLSESLLVPSAIHLLPTTRQIGHNGLPCHIYPSDHLSLATKFSWKTQNEDPT